MSLPPKEELVSNMKEYLRIQSQVGFERLWLVGGFIATVCTGVGLWWLLS